MSRFPDNPYSLDYFEQLLRNESARSDISEEELADLLENNARKPLPPALRGYLVRYLRTQALAIRRGRRAKMHPATLDFLLADAADLYCEALARFQDRRRAERAQANATGEKLPRGGPSPSQLAHEHVCEQMKDELGSISPERLRNLLSENRRNTIRERRIGSDTENSENDTLPSSLSNRSTE